MENGKKTKKKKLTFKHQNFEKKMQNLTRKTGKEELAPASKFSTQSVRASVTLEDAVKRILILELRQQKMEDWCNRRFEVIEECLDDLGEEEWQTEMKTRKTEAEGQESPDEEEW